ncbi:MAG: acetyl-CoA carboxylase biotin carboxyl carrier protein [Candidatus Acidiferrales bacterium]
MAKKSNPGSTQEGRPRGVDLAEVERLLAFMEKHGLEEFEYERDGVRVRLKKPSVHPQAVFRALPSHEPASAGAHAPTHSAPAAHPAGGSEPAVAAAGAENLHIIKSPIVGTFYSSASPESDAFVKTGAQVESGQVLCIIEAMKLMNEIEADVAGEVVRVFVENGQPVEYGEPLFGIRPLGKK